MLIEKLKTFNITTKQAIHDTDILFIGWKDGKSMDIEVEGIDLLVILI